MHHHHLEHQNISHSNMMETITVSKSSFNGGPQQFKLNNTETYLPISHNSAPKPYSHETTFSSPYLNNFQTIHTRQINLQDRPADDKEINIFDAQKYFNQGYEQFQNHTIKLSPTSITGHLAEFPRYSSVSSSVDSYSARNYRARSIKKTPMASSEASWNSQTGLLFNYSDTIKVSHGNLNPIVDEKKKSSSLRWYFGRICPCSGKKSIQVDDKTNASQARSPRNFRSANLSKQSDDIPTEKSLAGKITNTNTQNTHRLSLDKDRFAADQPPLRISLTTGRNTNHGAFPILKPSTTLQTVMKIKHHNKIAEEPPRDSMEVFHPSGYKITGPKTMTANLIEDDDDASDSSSDLFEISSFTTQKTYQTYENHHNYILHDSLDEAANFQNPRRLSVITSTINNHRQKSVDEPPTPTEGYEPSEASIDWSVTTAEGFDRASVATCEDTMMVDYGGRKSRGNEMLGLGCRNEKVGQGPLKFGPELVSSIPMPLHFHCWAYNKPPLASKPNQAHTRLENSRKIK